MNVQDINIEQAIKLAKFLLNPNNIMKLIDFSIDYITSIKRLYRIAFVLIVFISMFFIIIIAMLLYKAIPLSAVIAPIIFSLAAILASTVAIINIRENKKIEMKKNMYGEAGVLKLFLFTGREVQKQLLLIEKDMGESKNRSVYDLDEFIKIANSYTEQIYKQELLSLIDNDTLQDAMDSLFSKLRKVIHRIEYWKDTHFENTKSGRLFFESKSSLTQMQMRLFLEENLLFLNKIQEIIDHRVKPYRDLLLKEQGLEKQ